MRLSENALEKLARTEPLRLITLLESGELQDTDMTFGYERLGKHALQKHLDPILWCLIRALDSSYALVQEGAVYGLGYLLESYNFPEQRHVIDRLIHLSENAPSKGIRDAAKEAIILDWITTYP